MRNGHAPVSAQQFLQRYGKLPDAMFVRGDKLWMVETESAPKPIEVEVSPLCHRVAGLLTVKWKLPSAMVTGRDSLCAVRLRATT